MLRFEGKLARTAATAAEEALAAMECAEVLSAGATVVGIGSSSTRRSRESSEAASERHEA